MFHFSFSLFLNVFWKVSTELMCCRRVTWWSFLHVSEKRKVLRVVLLSWSHFSHVVRMLRLWHWEQEQQSPVSALNHDVGWLVWHSVQELVLGNESERQCVYEEHAQLFFLSNWCTHVLSALVVVNYFNYIAFGNCTRGYNSVGKSISYCCDDLGSIPSTHIDSQLYVITVPGIQCPLLTFLGISHILAYI